MQFLLLRKKNSSILIFIFSSLSSRCEPYLIICTHPSFKLFRNYLGRFEVYAGYGIHNATEAISAWLTCFLSVERYLAIKYHYIVKAYFSPPNVHKMLGAVFGLGALVNLPMFFSHTIGYEPQCNASLPVKQRVLRTPMSMTFIYKFYTWVRTFLVQFGPLLLLCVVNSLLIHIVRKQSQKRTLNKDTSANANTPAAVSANARNEKRARAQRKLTILLMVIIGLFLGGQIPQAFAYQAIFKVLYPEDSCPKCCNHVYRIFRMLAQNVCLFSYGANFFVYVSLNRHFRKALMDMCCLPCWSKIRREGRPNGTYKSVPLTTVTEALKSPTVAVNVSDEKNKEDFSPNHDIKNNNVVNDLKDDNDDVIDGQGIDDQELEAEGPLQDSEVCLDTGDEILTIRKSGATAV